MDYLGWNNRLAEHFFRPENSGRRVYLYATRELVQRIGQQCGATFQDFVDCVKRGPDWAHRSGLCQKVLEAMNGWRHRSLSYPPYIAPLSLFVIAAGLEGDFEPHEYYGRLWELLVTGESGMPPSFDKMLRVWDDLETWSVVDKGGELGVFKADPIGKWIHVGVPLAQTLLSEDERHVLRPTITIVIGRSNNWDKLLRKQLRILNSTLLNIKVLTYDHLLAMGNNILQLYARAEEIPF